MTKCRICQDHLDASSKAHGICYGCQLDDYIPRWYRKAEGTDTNLDGIVVAVKSPMTGVEILDMPQPDRVCDLTLTESEILYMRQLEQEML